MRENLQDLIGVDYYRERDRMVSKFNYVLFHTVYLSKSWNNKILEIHGK